MNALRMKGEAVRPWLQLVTGPVASLWLAAAIADNHSFPVLLAALLVAGMLAAAVYFGVRKTQDSFLLLAIGFSLGLLGAGALASIGPKWHIAGASISFVFLLTVPLVAAFLVAIAVLRPSWARSYNHPPCVGGSYGDPPFIGVSYESQQLRRYPEIYGSAYDRERFYNRNG